MVRAFTTLLTKPWYDRIGLLKKPNDKRNPKVAFSRFASTKFGRLAFDRKLVGSRKQASRGVVKENYNFAC